VTLHDVLTDARNRLVAAGISAEEAAVDVDLYACTLLGWDRVRLLTDRRDPVPAAFGARFSEWIARRERHEPSAYITGTREFWGLAFDVTPDVLIPRPETELVVEEALACLGGRRGAWMRIADIGTGSGCIAVALAHELHTARLVATDLSGSALTVAQRNAERHGVSARVTFVRTSYAEGIDGPFDLVTANPPYVRDGDRPALGRAVLHEPAQALFGGDEGLRDIRGVLDAAVRTLRPGGYLVMEFGLGQESAVRELITTRSTLVLERVREDLQGIARTAIIRRS
jgi:release factor glutamine methyltransferase